MLNWKQDENGRFRIERVVLSDLDCALKLKGEKLLDHRIGNVMWRSPEGQVGKGVGKPSEMFSFGLVVSELSSDKNVLAKHCFSAFTQSQVWKHYTQTLSSLGKKEPSLNR